MDHHLDYLRLWHHLHLHRDYYHLEREMFLQENLGKD
jgi:hypothetical protein